MGISNRMSRLATTVSTFIVVAALSFAPGLADGTGADGHPEEWTKLLSHLEVSGVPNDLQEGLAEKIAAGEPLDADSESATPVAESSTVEDGFTIVRKDYADGSFVESSVEIGKPAPAAVPGTVAPQAIKGCSSRSGTGYRQMSNCLVYVNRPTYSANFRASWIYTANGTGSISSVSDSSLQVYLGSFSNKTLRITRKTSSGSTPAQARMMWRYTAMGGVAQGDAAIYLNVSKNSAWTTTN